MSEANELGWEELCGGLELRWEDGQDLEGENQVNILMGLCMM